MTNIKIVNLITIVNAESSKNSSYAQCSNRPDFSNMFGAFRKAKNLQKEIEKSDYSPIKREQSLKDFHADRKYSYQ